MFTRWLKVNWGAKGDNAGYAACDLNVTVNFRARMTYVKYSGVLSLSGCWSTAFTTSKPCFMNQFPLQPMCTFRLQNDNSCVRDCNFELLSGHQNLFEEHWKFSSLKLYSKWIIKKKQGGHANFERTTHICLQKSSCNCTREVVFCDTREKFQSRSEQIPGFNMTRHDTFNATTLKLSIELQPAVTVD